MIHRRTGLIALLCGAACSPAAASEGYVYQNTATRVGTVNALVLAGAAASGVERGNTITLAGAERELANFTVHVRILSAGVATFDLRVRFYANDGAAGSPGTQLWDSGDKHVVIDSGADIGYYVPVPGVRVPNSFTWTAEIKNRAGFNQGILGLPHYNPPTLGSAPFGFWERTAGVGVWQAAGANEPPFGATIYATSCYANCNNSTTPPVLNVQDFGCFLNKFAAGDPSANCDASTTPPVLNVQDFGCFLNRFAAGCS